MPKRTFGWEKDHEGVMKRVEEAQRKENTFTLFVLSPFSKEELLIPYYFRGGSGEPISGFCYEGDSQCSCSEDDLVERCKVVYVGRPGSMPDRDRSYLICRRLKIEITEMAS